MMTPSSVQVAVAAVLMALASPSAAFVVPTSSTHNVAGSSNTALFDGNGTGGWGIGGSREITPEEFARGSRTAFDGYSMQERGEFMRSLRETQDALKKAELDELLGVARMAGVNVKDPKTRLNKFDPAIFDDDDDLDVSVDLDE